MAVTAAGNISLEDSGKTPQSCNREVFWEECSDSHHLSMPILEALNKWSNVMDSVSSGDAVL